MRRARSSLAITTFALLASSSVLGQSSTTSSETTQRTASSTLKLAKLYVGDDFLDDFDYYTDDDPTSGYVNYVSKSAGQSSSLVEVQSDDTFIMRADSDNVASGRGRDSIRISSQDYFADGVYILDLNHMPVGCGTWPAFWTVVETGWPVGGEIDIIEGVNGLPTQYSTAWNATTGILANATGQTDNIVSLHTSDTCTITGGSYMNGQVSETDCNSYDNDNAGCGITMDGGEEAVNGSYGAGVNAEGGGWYALWRDLENSGGIYVYFWPRYSDSVPDDVRDADTTSTDLSGWGTPNANFSIPDCTSDFGDHVIVFDLTFCGDYGDSTYTSAGCPGTCSSFVQSTPAAYTEAYWSINSLRVYTASGKSASDSSGDLSKGAIAGIVVGSVAGVVILGLFLWRCRARRRQRAALRVTGGGPTNRTNVTLPGGPKPSYTKVAATRKPRLGPTTLAPGKRADDFLDGETPIVPKLYQRAATGSPSSSDIKLTDTSSYKRSETPEVGRRGGGAWVG